MTGKMNILTAMPLTFLLILLFPGHAVTQGGDPEAVEILETLQQRYEASIEGIDDYVVVMNGRTIYHKKAYDNGRPYFKTRGEGEFREDAEAASKLRDADFFSEVYSAVKERASYEGTGEIEGHRVHRIYIDRLEALIDDPHLDETLEDVWLYIDTDQWVVRQMAYTVEFTTDDGEVREISPVIQHRDYRNVEGMMLAYEIVTEVSGLALTDEERRQAEEAMDEFEKQMEEMPQAQRQMLEQMMGGRIEEFKKMLEEDRLEIKSRVEEVRVNTGLEDF